MKGDMMFCIHCKRFFNDIHEVHDTRHEDNFRDKCPWCLATNSVNASWRIMRSRFHDQHPTTIMICDALAKKKGVYKEMKTRWKDMGGRKGVPT